MESSTKNQFKYESTFPVAIVSKNGIIENENCLLKEKTLQITTSESDFLVMQNNRSTNNAYIVIDFGKELHGRLRILTYTADGKGTPVLRVTYGESISEALSTIGSKGATNDHATRDFNFTFPPYSDISLNESGFRYAKIELLNKNMTIRIKSITATAIYRDIEYLGSFCCSNETLNRIYNTAAYTCHLCMQQFIWDGIKRDRLVWVGDMHPEMLAVKTIFGANSIIDDSIRFMRDTTPLPAWMNGMPTYSLWWLIILWDWYFYTGNKDFLRENEEYAVKLIKIVCETVNSDGSDNLPSYFLDWPCRGKEAGVSGSRALLAYSLEKSAHLAEFFNDKELSECCKNKKAILLSQPSENHGAKQVEAFYSLAGWTDKTSSAEMILKNGCEGFSTFMSYYLLRCAANLSMNDTLNALEEYYGTMLKMGATTFWEDFDIRWADNAFGIDCLPQKNKNDIHGDFGAFCYTGLRHSLCHGWSSGPVAFLAENVLGINIIEAGCKKVKISPDIGSLTFAKGTYPTPYGVLYVEINKKTDGSLAISYRAPDEIEIITE